MRRYKEDITQIRNYTEDEFMSLSEENQVQLMLSLEPIIIYDIKGSAHLVYEKLEKLNYINVIGKEFVDEEDKNIEIIKFIYKTNVYLQFKTFPEFIFEGVINSADSLRFFNERN